MPTIDPNPAPWLAALIVGEQKTEDERFAKAEADYQSAASQWVANAILCHQSGAPVPPWQRVLPSKEVYQAVSQSDPTFGAQPFTSHVVFDPNLQPPVEPPNTIVPAPSNAWASLDPTAGTQFENYVRDSLAKIMGALKLS